jgi:transposase
MAHEFPHWRLVYYYFAKWQKEGVWEKLNAALRDRVRIKAGKKAPAGGGDHHGTTTAAAASKKPRSLKS